MSEPNYVMLAVNLAKLEHRLWRIERMLNVKSDAPPPPDYRNPDPPTQTFDTNLFKGFKL